MTREPSSNNSPAPARRILLTGSSGVVGAAVLAELHDRSVTVLRHRARPDPSVRDLDVVGGNISKPRLGLAEADYERLVAETDCVINCAGLSHAGSTPDELHAVNVTGTRELLGFCATAGASLVHVSTAADVISDEEEPSPFSVLPYLRSKREADLLVQASELDAAIAKPSQVIGDAASGATPRFQGFHRLGQLLLEDELGVLPMEADASADFLPRDTVARAIVAIADRPTVRGEWWLTAGPYAPTIERLVEIAGEYSRSIGRPAPPVRLIGPDVVDRLVRPALLPELPRRARLRFEYAIEFSRLIQPREGDDSYVFPTSIPELLGDDRSLSTEVLEGALLSSIDYWARQVGLADRRMEVVS